MVLAHPRYTKPQKDSKIDRKDAKWIFDLFMCDMIKPSFIPPPDIRQMRDWMMCFQTCSRNPHVPSSTTLRSAHGYVKLYNRQIESKLSSLLTRLEVTLDPSVEYEDIHFPTVYYVDNSQLEMEELRVTDTERFILNAILQGYGTTYYRGMEPQNSLVGKRVKNFHSRPIHPDRRIGHGNQTQSKAALSIETKAQQTVVPDFEIDTLARCLLPQI